VSFVMDGVHSWVRIWRRYQTGGFEAIPGGGTQKSHLPPFFGTCQNRTALHRFDTLGCSQSSPYFFLGPASTGPNLRSAFDGPGTRRNRLQGRSDCVHLSH
jgi:hypothetical protein